MYITLLLRSSLIDTSALVLLHVACAGEGLGTMLENTYNYTGTPRHDVNINTKLKSYVHVYRSTDFFWTTD